MTIAIDISPLQNANSVRGVGFYTKRLITALKQHSPQHQYHFVDNQQTIDELNPDLIHYPYFDPFFLTLPMRKDKPIVVTVHDCILLAFPQFFPKGIKGWLRLQAQTFKLQKADAVLTDSFHSQKDIGRYYRINRQKIHVAHLAVEETFQPITDPTILARIRAKYALPEKFIIKVGDINPTKNFKVTFEALAQIPEAQLVLVGKALVADRENKPIIPELQAILDDIQKYDLQNRVHRVGFVPDEDIPAIYSLAKGTLQNSLYEGFGLPALESLACGTPVISGNNSSLPEIVGDTGIKIDAQNVKQTVDAIASLLSASESEGHKLSELSVAQSKKFSLEKLAHDTVSVYESVTR